jgi:hypothetical protein
METKFAVQLINNGFTFYLRGTTWTSDPARANLFPDPALASAALAKAKKFTKPALFKRAEIITMEG